MNKLKLTALGLALALMAAGPLTALGQGGKPQTTCPVMGGNINKEVYIDYQGQRVYFCCKACDAEFRKDPDKFVKKMEAQGITLEKCPPGQEKSGK